MSHCGGEQHCTLAPHSNQDTQHSLSVVTQDSLVGLSVQGMPFCQGKWACHVVHAPKEGNIGDMKGCPVTAVTMVLACNVGAF